MTLALARYVQSARHYQAGQIVARLRLFGRRLTWYRWPSLAARKYEVREEICTRPVAVTTLAALASLPSDVRPRVAGEAQRLRALVDDLVTGSFTFLNQRRTLGRPVDWAAAGATRLWRYNLHYFDYLSELARADRWFQMPRARAETQALVLDWIRANPLPSGAAWHAYPIARRIPNWIQSATLFDHETETGRQFLKSLYQQTRFLADHLEFDSLGNHLLADARALVWAGHFFDGPEAASWRQQGMKLLVDGLGEQILADGGHYERSPMYHALMLADYLDTLAFLRAANVTIPSGMRERLIQMSDWLAAMRHPDGEIPLFADSALGIAPATTDVLAAASVVLECPRRWAGASGGPFSASLGLAPADQPSTPTRRTLLDLASSGYVVMEGSREGDTLIADWRPIEPAHIPAHGHCSLFSYELSMAGRRVIVDSGVDEYEAGVWRMYWRSTRAHNTVSVDDEEQSDVWGAFRVARRARLFGRVVTDAGGVRVAAGAHDGFRHRGVRHERFLVATDDGRWFVMDRVVGRGRHRIRSFIHFHPDVECEGLADGACWRKGNLEGRVVLAEGGGVQTLIERGAESPAQGWYADAFGRKRPATVVTLQVEGELPLMLGYAIVPAAAPSAGAWSWRIAAEEGSSVLLEWRAGTADGRWPIQWTTE